MELSLSLKENDCLTKEEKLEIDKQIDNVIARHKCNTVEINRLVFDSITALTTSESRASELAEQGRLKRFWGGLTGKNQKIQSEIDAGFARAQYSSQQTIQKLAEQNLMSFELLTAVNNKLNSSIIEIESEINTIYSTLVTFFKQSKSDIIQLENRVERLEKNVSLLNWVNTIEYQMYNGMEYSELSDIEKIVCLIKDFYEITKGNWTTSDILLLKSALSEVGLSSKSEIKYIDFIESICEREELYNVLMKDKFMLPNACTKYMPLISGIAKSKKLDNEEKYIVKSLEKYLLKEGIEKDKTKLKYDLAKDYIEETELANLDSSINIFDFIIEILFSFNQMELINDIEQQEKMLKKAEEYYLDYKIEKAYEIFLTLAEKGNARAMYFLGNILKSGLGEIDRDYNEAIKWTTIGYEKNNPLCAMNYLYLIKNNIIEISNEEIKEEILKNNFCLIFELAENGDAFAQNILGNRYHYGEGVEKDLKAAIKWFRKSAEQGYFLAEENIGIMYENGSGTEQNYEEAVKWYRKAARHGYRKVENR